LAGGKERVIADFGLKKKGELFRSRKGKRSTGMRSAVGIREKTVPGGMNFSPQQGRKKRESLGGNGLSIKLA